jgi:SM-20-related protein
MTETTNPALQGLASGGIVRHRIAHFDDFLAPAEVEHLAAQVFAAEPMFVPSAVSDGKDSYRKSFVLNPPAALTQGVVNKIRHIMPEVMTRLKMKPFQVTQIECQVTANTDGSFFRVHTDAGHNNTIKRQFTYVYYFNHQPKAFSGGELRIYDDIIRNGKLARTESFQVVEPRHNSIVFFQAAVMHEVTPVVVPSGLFHDGRFTVNGWIQRA